MASRTLVPRISRDYFVLACYLRSLAKRPLYLVGTRPLELLNKMAVVRNAFRSTKNSGLIFRNCQLNRTEFSRISGKEDNFQKLT